MSEEFYDEEYDDDMSFDDEYEDNEFGGGSEYSGSDAYDVTKDQDKNEAMQQDGQQSQVKRQEVGADSAIAKNDAKGKQKGGPGKGKVDKNKDLDLKDLERIWKNPKIRKNPKAIKANLAVKKLLIASLAGNLVFAFRPKAVVDPIGGLISLAASPVATFVPAISFLKEVVLPNVLVQSLLKAAVKAAEKGTPSVKPAA